MAASNFGNTGVAGDYARTTPAVAGSKLIFGDQGGKFGAGARVTAVDKATGNLLWITLVKPKPFGMVTQSAIVDGNTVYVGVASFEEVIAALDPTYPCCSERGSILALNAATGGILWSFTSGGACNAGAAISNGTVYWGSAYRQFFTGNNVF